ncbi:MULTISPECIES: 2-phospho-L-lactate guanylyltransferase [Cellulosimicrobium]|uniref:2-phospho-L-lactate guanylyltransferase n=1 Tax=Cellulosimicrobium TaxID=157920 RepID=UPI00209686C0|nr:2-phospho-L-lactate guanylyltransferase [Cellulosimicrobium cellulans]MCO7274514.1 2-phospho-L-lactate guanylyltransferase [Cellulosimicrobium cellulans]
MGDLVVPDGAARPGGPARPGRVVAVVPLRDGSSGKSRLAHVLDPAARSRLIAVLARHVVGTLLASDGVERVVVVTSDPRFTWRALRDVVVDESAGAADAAASDGLLLTDDADRLRIVLQPADRPGLDAAVDLGREIAARDESPEGPVRLLVAHADLPALTPADVAALLAEDAPVVVATDRGGTGTNLLVLDPPASAPTTTGSLSETGSERREPRARRGSGPVGDGFRFRFGAGSRAAHVAEAARLGLRAVVVQRPGTAVDLDTVEDWDELPADARAVVGLHVPALRDRDA